MPLDPIEITGGLAIGTGLGGAISDTVTPRLQSFKNGQWASHTDVPLPASLAAEVAAEDVSTYDAMRSEASFTGYDAARFANLYGVTLGAPGMGELLAMIRRGTIGGDDFTHGLRKARLETRWDAALRQLAVQYIGIGDIATAIVRGAVPAPSWVPVAPPTTTDNVPRFPVTDIDPVELAAKLGFDEDMLRIMTARSGLSLAPILATNALFRGVLSENDWLLAIAEGDLRTEWATTLREAARQIPTVGEAAELQLRGYIDQATRRALAGRHGMTHADSDLIYDVLGRGVSIRQAYLGLARGGTYDGTPQTIPEPFLSAARRSNLRPEWYSLAYENRYSLPSAFVVRALLSDGAIDATRGETILVHSGWPADLAQIVAQHYAAKAGGGGDPHIAKAQTQLWTTTHRSYVAEETDDQQATTALQAVGVADGSIPNVLTLWQHERSLIRRQLSPAQVKKAYAEQVLNPATGAAWTRDEALAALIARGYNPNDAATFLEL